MLLIIPEKVTSLATVKLRVAAPSALFPVKVNAPVFVPSPSVTSPPNVIALLIVLAAVLPDEIVPPLSIKVPVPTALLVIVPTVSTPILIVPVLNVVLPV